MGPDREVSQSIAPSLPGASSLSPVEGISIGYGTVIMPWPNLQLDDQLVQHRRRIGAESLRLSSSDKRLIADCHTSEGMAGRQRSKRIQIK